MTIITGVTALSPLASSGSHFLGELREPVGDQQRGVDKPLHAVGHAGLLPPGEAAAEAASDAGVEAGRGEVMHLLHDLHLLLLSSDSLLEVSASQARACVTQVQSRGESLAHSLSVSRGVRSGDTHTLVIKRGINSSYYLSLLPVGHKFQ